MKLIDAILYIAILAGSLSSCNSGVKKERNQRIDSLGIHLNYVEETLAQLDSVLIENRLVDNVTDTLNRKAGIAVGDFIRSGKFLDQAKSRYHEVSKELRFSKKQLETLRADVKKNFYSEEEFRGYFNTEAQSISKLVSATDELKEKYEKSNEFFARQKPLVKEAVDSVKAIIYGAEPVSR